jgi:cytochrome c553
MKYIGLLLAMPPAILAMAFSTKSFAAGTDTEAISNQDLQAKIQYCQDCHGMSGQGLSGGYLTIPRIAGQTPKYIEKQLLAFNEAMRDKNSAVGMTTAHALKPAMRPALAAYFSSLNPEPTGGGPRDLVDTGKKIYEEGVPEANVAACSGCHGPEAKGKNEIPRLAGQLNSYTEKELTDWSKLRGQNPLNEGAAAPMKQVAHSLSPSQIAALAAYLSYLKT